ncbi:MAG: glycosyltransferase family 4 protein [Sphingopyxis sp.]|nr:glycosyltransferase family 4 protein [Sphingopyxis sp.]
MTTKRNILFIGNYPPPFGGVPLHIELLSGYLAARGWSCHVLSGGVTGTERIGDVMVHKPGYVRKARGAIRQSFNRDFDRWPDGRDFVAEQPAMARRYRMFADVGSAIVRRERIDLIASYNLLSYAPVGAWLSEQFDLPHVVTIFGEIFKFPEMARHAGFFRAASERAHKLLSCSEHCGRSLTRLGVERRVDAVTFGIDLKRFHPGEPPVDLRDRLGFSDAPVVLFVGRLTREMGLDSFIAAAETIQTARPDTQFLIVGQEGDFADEAESRAATWPGNMAVVRNAPYDELPLYYRLADVLLVPTRGDRTCSSLAGMEAMATRVAVAAFAIGGVPEIVIDDDTGLLVPPEDTDRLAHATLRLLEDAQLRERMAAAGFAQAQARLGEQHMNAAMEAQFAELLARQ